MNSALNVLLRRNLFVDMERMVKFDVFVVSGSSLLSHTVGADVHLDVGSSTVMVEKGKFVVRCILSR